MNTEQKVCPLAVMAHHMAQLCVESPEDQKHLDSMIEARNAVADLARAAIAADKILAWNAIGGPTRRKLAAALSRFTSKPAVIGTHDLPLAADGLKSYRYPSYYGWVMIGAKDDAEALKEAQRSVPHPVDKAQLQAWNGREYVPAGGAE